MRMLSERDARKMMFTVIDVRDKTKRNVYAVRNDVSPQGVPRFEFLMWNPVDEWYWMNAWNYEPVK